jgi:predicted CXXCH cytochrome family protein
VKESGVVHEPAEDDCLGCHDPHASSDSPSLLTDSEPGLCLGCHDPTDSGFARGHLDYPVTSTSCSVCHDPHGSNQSALLKDNVHNPVAKRMCGQCHKGEPSPDTIPPAGGNIETCSECHKKTVDEALERANVHWPVLDKEGCLRCHDPHASGQPALLNEPMLDLCGGCHLAVVSRQQRSKVKHEPVMEGECNACHSPHASDHPYLFNAATDMDVCADCHEYQRHSTHPIGENVKDPRNTNLSLDCASCHRAHGTEYDHMFPFATYTFLCIQCHTDMRR